MKFNGTYVIAIVFLLLNSVYLPALPVPSTPNSASDNGKSVDFGEMLKQIRKSAEQGSRSAQRLLGQAYLEGGRGVPKDEKLAEKWIKKAAKQNDPIAQRLYGMMYLEGRGVESDNKKAKKWIEKAAKEGDPPAQAYLGAMYIKGESVPQDYEEAAKWFRSAAEQGLTEAQYSLGLMYLKGEGIAQDYEEAKKWLGKIAHRGHVEAQYALGTAYAQGSMTEEDVFEAYKWLTLYVAASSDMQARFLTQAKHLRESLASNLTTSQTEEAEKWAREWQPIDATKPKPIKGNVLRSKRIAGAEPVYPQLALRTRVTGTVVLAVTVDEYGDVEDVRVMNGHPLLSDAAVTAVRTWKFQPLEIDGEPTRVTATITVSFNLGDVR